MYSWKWFEKKWSGRADLAGKCPWKGHNQKDTSSPEAIRVIRMASQPTLPPHLIGGMTRVAPYSSRRHSSRLPAKSNN
jgi:hypothetical protein